MARVAACALVCILTSFVCSMTFNDLPYEEIQRRAAELAGQYALAQSAHEMYGITPASVKGSTCSPNIIRVSHVKSLPADSERPQIVVSGEIHGDERVGPSSSMLIAEVLVWAANCEIEKQPAFCARLGAAGIKTAEQRIWLASLATRRDSIIIPTANCLGYMLNQREDAGVDPNRDFPYSRKDDQCLRSTTAKIFYAIMSSTIAQIVVTFHGGMAAIGYEWGSRNHIRPNDKTPDDQANAEIAAVMKTYAGAFSGQLAYATGRINSIVYPVDGGMEDWLYAAGWDKATNRKCKETFAFNGTSAGENEVNNRALVFLVETSDLKKPRDPSLGGPDDLLNNKAPSNGHVPRNLRLALLSIDILQPYTCFSDIKSTVSTSGLRVELGWFVGGSFAVDQTFLAVVPAPLSSDELLARGSDYSFLLRTLDHVGDIRSSDGASGPHRKVSTVDSGRSRWDANATGFKASFYVTSHSAENSAVPVSVYNGSSASGSDLHVSLSPGAYWIVGWSMVDQGWGAAGQGFPEESRPQSFLVNARSNVTWRSRNGEKSVTGRLLWPSDPLVLLVSDKGEVVLDSIVKQCAWWQRKSSANYEMFRPTSAAKIARNGSRSHEGGGSGSQGESMDNRLEGASKFTVLTYVGGDAAAALWRATYSIVLLSVCASIFLSWSRIQSQRRRIREIGSSLMLGNSFEVQL